MRTPRMVAGVLAASLIGTLAHAGDDDCFVPMSKWQPLDAVRAMAQEQGWEVRRIKIDDGCYEIKGYDQSGAEIEVKLDPGTLAIVDFEYEDDEDHDDDDEDHRYKKE